MNSHKGDDKIIRTPNPDYIPDPRGLGYVFYTQMQKHKNNLAQIDGLTGERDSYGSLHQRCIRTAITMRSKGINPGDIITLCTYNHLDSCVPFFSTTFLGAISASLDPTLSLTDTISLLKQVTPKLIFVVPEAVEMIEEAVKDASPKTQIVVFGNTSKHIPFGDFLQPSLEEETFKPFETKSLWDTVVIFFSSGTSGLPKGICVNHFAYLSQIVNYTNCGYDIKITLGFASFYWVTSAILWGGCVFEGSARLILPSFNASNVWEKIHQYKPTFILLAPSQLIAMHDQGRPKYVNIDSLKDTIVAGGSILKDHIVNIRKAMPESRVCLGYGQTEVFGFLACQRPSSREDMSFLEDKPLTSGRGVPGITYKIVDPETQEILGPNRQGELRVKTKFQLNGYYNLDASDAWDSEGWVRTGDVVYYDDDLCFYVVDRIKEMLKFQSWHVPPALIENVLLNHPAIKTAVVIGIPNDLDGDHPMGVVVLKEEFVGKEIEPEEIVKFVEERVHDRQRLRGGVKIVEKLPTTPTGKVRRREVKNMILINKA